MRALVIYNMQVHSYRHCESQKSIYRQDKNNTRGSWWYIVVLWSKRLVCARNWTLFTTLLPVIQRLNQTGREKHARCALFQTWKENIGMQLMRSTEAWWWTMLLKSVSGWWESSVSSLKLGAWTQNKTTALIQAHEDCTMSVPLKTHAAL